MTSYYIDTHQDPYPGLVRCGSRTFRREYRTLVARLRIWSGTSSRYRIVSGFVAGLHLDTGHDPAPGVPAC